MNNILFLVNKKKFEGMVKRGRSWTEVYSNCRVGLIIEMSVASRLLLFLCLWEHPLGQPERSCY